MTALILKDIASLKKSLFLAIAICAGITGYGIYEKTIFMIPFAFVMVPLILTAIAFGYDTRAKFEQFLFSMPVRKRSYVLSKLFFAVAFGLAGSICVGFCSRIWGKMPMDKVVLISLLTLVASMLISAIQLPFIFKYGAEKGRLIMLITYFVVFAASAFLKEKASLLGKIMEVFRENSLTAVCGVISLAGLILVGIAVEVSVLIMKKKEY